MSAPPGFAGARCGEATQHDSRQLDDKAGLAFSRFMRIAGLSYINIPSAPFVVDLAYRCTDIAAFGEITSRGEEGRLRKTGGSLAMSFMSFVRRYPRSIAVIAVLSLSATGLTLGGYDSLAATLKSNWKARDATRYTLNPNLAPYGMKNIVVAYENSLWPSGASKSTPNASYILNTYIPKIKSQNPDVVVIDIEVWKLEPSSSSSEVTAVINKFKTVIGAFRKGLPNTKIGLYMGVPYRNWLAPCGDPGKRASRMTSWRNHNLRLKPLADAVDIIFPSLYTFYSDTTSINCWPTYANANIKEARIYGKPVWAFLWMKYHTTGAWIPRTFWRKQLDTTYASADGLVVWSKAGTDPWSWSAPWWLETKDFLADMKLVP